MSRIKTSTNGTLAVTHPRIEEHTTVTIKPIDVAEMTLTVRGLSPLIMYKFSEKARNQIAEKQQKKARTAKEARDPNAEYLEACYTMPGCKAGAKNCEYGFPVTAFKNSAVHACGFIEGMTKVMARGAFFVLDDGDGLAKIKFGTMRMRTDTVRISMGTTTLRYRPEFSDWSCKLRIRYNASVITPTQIVHLFNTAGFCSGIGEMRPSQKCGGPNGMFEVEAK